METKVTERFCLLLFYNWESWGGVLIERKVKSSYKWVRSMVEGCWILSTQITKGNIE